MGCNLPRGLKKEAIMKALRYDKTFTGWLTLRRYERDWSMQELADRIHVTKQHVSNITSGRNKPTFGFVAACCYVFNDGDDPEEIYQKYLKEELN